MSGAIPLLTLYAIMVWAGNNLLLVHNVISHMNIVWTNCLLAGTPILLMSCRVCSVHPH